MATPDGVVMAELPPRSPPVIGGPLVHCPNCGRYIGPVPKCPFCDFKMPKKKSYNALKWGTLVWGVVGLLLLLALYGSQPNPLVKIGDLGRENNYSYITIEGVITNTPSYYPADYGEGGSLYFVVDDGTGEILVKTYQQTTVELVEMGKIPAYGDRVRLQGNFQYRGYEFSLILNSGEQLEIFREDPIQMTIVDIENAEGNDDMTTQRVTVEGKVSYWKKFDWAIDIYISDENGSMVDIWIPQSITDLTGDGDVYSIYEGATVRVTGALEWYEAGSYSRWEIIPASSDDFVIISEGGV